MARHPFRIDEELLAEAEAAAARCAAEARPEPELRPTAAVAIVGRPNVGKSSLFNALLGRRIAITDRTPGTTRDRLLHPLACEGKVFDLIDTGGIGIVDVPDLAAQVERQISVALEEADILVFLVDAAEGLTPLDRAVAERVRRLDKPFLFVANKVDNPARQESLSEFAELGMGEPLAVSAVHRQGLAGLLEAIADLVPPPPPPDASSFRVSSVSPPEVETPRFAILGRRSSGKSTFVNCLAGTERVIVHEAPGTTRDAVDVRFERDGRSFVAIDTAGLRKARATRTVIELSALFRAERALRRADVVILLFDAVVQGLLLEKELITAILATAKPCVLAVNKWDLASAAGVTPEEYARYLRENLPGLAFAPIIFIAAKENLRVWETIELALELRRQARTRRPTPEVNRVLRAAVEANPPRAPHSSRQRQGSRGQPRVYYATQISVAPPTILLFVNNPSLFPEPYRRYLQEAFRQGLEATEIPIRLLWKKRERREQQKRGGGGKRGGGRGSA